MTELRARVAAAALLMAIAGCTTGSGASGPFGLGGFRSGRRAPVVAADTTSAAPMIRSTGLPLRDEPEPVAASSAPDGVSRLVQLARVWQLITLHHPWVAARGIPLDSAFVHAATLVRRAEHPDTLALAYRRFLAVLDDPLTHVDIDHGGAAVPSSAVDEAPVAVGVETTRDSVLVVRLPPARRYADQADAVLRDALSRLPATGPVRVVLDLRTTTPVPPDSLEALLTRVAFVEQLAATPVATSSVRVRRVGGARVARGQVTDDDGWLMHDGALITGRRMRTPHLVVIANANTALPLSLLGLLANPGTSLVTEAPLDDGWQVPSVHLSIGNGYRVRVRTGELWHPDGRVGLVADTIVSPPPISTAADSAPAWRVAMQRVRAPIRPRTVRPLQLAPAPFPAHFDTSAYPVMGARLLAGARLWHLMRERHAHRELYDEDIDERFAQLIPALERARTAVEYARAIEGFVSAFDDGQVAVEGASLDTVRGIASLPFRVRWIDGRALVTDVVRDSVTRTLGIDVGQELMAVDGFPLTAWLSEHRRTVSATNEWTRTFLLMDRLVRGPRGGALVRLRDAGGRERQLTVPRSEQYPALLPRTERSASPPARMLAGSVLYLDANRLTPQTVDQELARLREARGAILDLRGMLVGGLAATPPSPEGTADGALPIDEQLAARVLAVTRRTPSAVIAQEVHRYRSTPCLAVLLRQATQECSEERVLRGRVTMGDTVGTFRGPIVALIDERTRGTMERLAAAVASVAEVTFIGAPTAGAPAEPIRRSLPGGLTVTVPLVELRRTDGSQWQRIGVTPVIDSRLSVRTVRIGSDDVIDRAHQWLQRQLDGTPRRR